MADRLDARDRILRSVEENEQGCWLWTGALSKSGYGSLGFKGRMWRAHRLAFYGFVGDIGDLHVLHRCDNPRCVRPEHLFLGTPADNAADKSAKGRTGVEKRSGELNNKAKLTEADVLMIRTSDKSGNSIAHELGVSRALVNMVRRGEIWRHING